MNQKQPIRFATTSRDFVVELNRRVNDYFTSNNIKKSGNNEMFFKTVIMFAIYLIPYFLIVTGVASGWTLLVLLALVMGIGLAGIGLSVMHDANHGAYSSRSWVNKLIGYSLNFIGANATTWKIQHNVMHHTFTNVHDEDEDISPRGALRLSPDSPWKRVHRFQFLYAWLLYGLMTIVWIAVKDFVRLIRYHRSGMLKKQKTTLLSELLIMLGSKAFYATYIFVIPLLVTSLLWWQIIIGILIMHYLTGFILAIIFQPAHVIEGTHYPKLDENNSIRTNWAIHQLLTTTNFGTRSRWFTWYVGGLNFQIEHHLFPHICHVHYRKISGIVKQTVTEFGLPYRSYKTFIGALTGHTKQLIRLGNPVQSAKINPLPL